MILWESIRYDENVKWKATVLHKAKNASREPQICHLKMRFCEAVAPQKNEILQEEDLTSRGIMIYPFHMDQH